MRKLALVVALTVAASGVGFGAPAAASGRGAARPATTKEIKHYCHSLDDFIRFLRKAPKPSKFDTRRGRKVLRNLERHAPDVVETAAKTVAASFRTMSRHGKDGLTPAEHKKTNAAVLKVAVFGATKCDQKLVKAYASALVQARIAAADRESSAKSEPAK